MVPWWTIPLAVIFGGSIGMILLAMCVVAGRDDERSEEMRSVSVINQTITYTKDGKPNNA